MKECLVTCMTTLTATSVGADDFITISIRSLKLKRKFWKKLARPYHQINHATLTATNLMSNHGVLV